MERGRRGQQRPGPLFPRRSNAANAPAWQPEHCLHEFPKDNRVLAGPAYSPSSSFSTASYVAYGDSITLGDYAGVAYPTVIATDKSLSLTNDGSNGLQTGYMSALVLANENPGASGNPIYSMLIGTNDATASDTSGVPAYVNNLEASATWLTVPSTTKVSASSCTQSGPWGTESTNPNVNAMPAGTMVNQSSGSTLTCPITVINGSVYMWYTGGVATISIDGGPPIGNGLGSNSYYRYVVRATGIAPGAHNVTIAVNASGVGSDATHIVGIGTPGSRNCCRLALGGVLRQQGDNNGTVTAAYNAAAYSAYSDLASDGLNVSFVPVRDYANDTTDMANQLHPNTTGQEH